MTLVQNANKWYKMFSVQAMVLATTILGVWQTIPEDMKSTVPPEIVHLASMVVLVAGVIGRLTHQPGVDDVQESK